MLTQALESSARSTSTPRVRDNHRRCKPKILYTNGHDDVLVLEADAVQAYFVPVPIRRETTVQSARQEAFHASMRMTPRERSLPDEHVVVDALLAIAPIHADSEAGILADCAIDPDIAVIQATDLPANHRLVRCASVRILESLVDRYEHVRIVGVDLRMSDALFPYLQHNTRDLRLTRPSVRTAIAIAYGHRLSLSDCRDKAIWLESRWDGTATVTPMTTDGGGVVYEVLGGRKTWQKSARERDWLCDTYDLRTAVDLAALINASADHLYNALRAS